MTDEQEQVESEGVQGFLSRALRRKQPGSYEQLLCQHLIKFVASEPMEKIRLISEAAMMVPDTPVDKDILDVIYQIATTLNQTRKDMKDPYDLRMWHHIIAWGFKRNDENFDRYIRPWLTTFEALYHGKIDEAEGDYENASLSERFWIVTRHIHVAGLAVLETRFLTWALPKIMEIFTQLSKLVSPDLYESMLEKMKV